MKDRGQQQSGKSVFHPIYIVAVGWYHFGSLSPLRGCA